MLRMSEEPLYTRRARGLPDAAGSGQTPDPFTISTPHQILTPYSPTLNSQTAPADLTLPALAYLRTRNFQTLNPQPLPSGDTTPLRTGNTTPYRMAGVTSHTGMFPQIP